MCTALKLLQKLLLFPKSMYCTCNSKCSLLLPTSGYYPVGGWSWLQINCSPQLHDIVKWWIKITLTLYKSPNLSAPNHPKPSHFFHHRDSFKISASITGNLCACKNPDKGIQRKSRCLLEIKSLQLPVLIRRFKMCYQIIVHIWQLQIVTDL